MNDITLRLLLSFLQPLCGALILLWLYFWLRTRQVKDGSLFWLFLTLVTAAIPGLVRFLAPSESVVWLTYGFASPLTNVVTTLTAFRLLRIREQIRYNERLRAWSSMTQWTVCIGAVIVMTLVLFAQGKQGWLLSLGIKADSAVSLLALMTLAICLSYSFYRYGNQPLIVLTLADFIYVVVYQFELASHPASLGASQVYAALNIISVSVMTMLFIALTLSWAISHASRLQFDDSTSVRVIVMFVDIRDSTKWAKEIGDGKYVVTFFNKFLHWMVKKASEPPYGLPSVKYTGDGMMLVWEVSDQEDIITRANSVVGLACALFSGYESWVRSRPEFYKPVPQSIGIGVDFDSAIRLTGEAAQHEYNGLPANFAAKFQGLARPNGGVVIRDNWVLSDELRDRFTRKGKVEIAGECVPVRATSEVRFTFHNGNGNGNGAGRKNGKLV
ncbi:MAG TPA: hypothetical protein VJ749_15370 [Pyrinomonadaceae bacterium]|nr:hypothetical protein [Pyrinomonadaceae bacterium]